MRFKTTIQRFRSMFMGQPKAGTVKAAGIHPYNNSIENDIVFERITLENGLPHATVLSIIQDQIGFMWFATHNGLARYDGYRFRNFQHHPDDPTTIPSNLVFCLFQDHDHQMWVGTDGGGLSRFDPETETFFTYQHQSECPTSLSNNSVWTIAEDQQGNLWVGTRNGINRFDPETETFTRYLVNMHETDAIENLVIYYGTCDVSGVMWFGTRNGLYRYNQKTDDFTAFRNDPNDPHSISGNKVWSIFEDNQHRFWVGTRRNGLNWMDRSTGKFDRIQHEPGNPGSISDDTIWDILQDSKGTIWLTTEVGGLNRFDEKTQTFHSYQHHPDQPTSLSSNDVFALCEDRFGSLWIGSRDAAICHYYPALQRFHHYRYVPGNPVSLSSNNVQSIAKNGNTLWVGLKDGLLNSIDQKNGTVREISLFPDQSKPLTNSSIKALHVENETSLWVGTLGEGVFRYHPLTQTSTQFKKNPTQPNSLSSDYITALCPAGKDALWVGTLGLGLNLLNTQNGVCEQFIHQSTQDNSLSDNTIYALYADSETSLWIGTARGGLNHYDREHKLFTHYQHVPHQTDSILKGSVNAICRDHRGHLWCAISGGISVLNPKTHLFSSFTTQNGLLSDQVYGIACDLQGRIWASTSAGLIVFDPLIQQFRHFNTNNGLQGIQFNLGAYHQSADGELFFGGPNGLNAFTPKNPFEKEEDIQLVFTDFKIFNRSTQLERPVHLVNAITIKETDSAFTFEFAALYYQISKNIRYQFKLEGFDKEWSPATHTRNATYTNLNPGNYRFRVRATDLDGMPYSNELKMKVEILPKWYKTTAFKLASGAATLALVSLGLNLRVKRIKKQNRVLEERVSERTTELSAEIQRRRSAEQEVKDTNQTLREQLKQIKILHQQLKEQAIRDPLTNLYNRRFLTETLELELKRAKRNGRPVSVMIIDVDHFKTINDQFGHETGDKVLTALSRRLELATRKGDIVCRYGGEEFVIVLPRTSSTQAYSRAEEIRKDIEQDTHLSTQANIHLTISIGTATSEDANIDPDALMNLADQALYEAKAQGRNCVIQG